MQTSDKPSRILVIGGGFSGLTTAVDAAESGAEVIIVEKNAYLGGRVAQLNKYFPKMCPPVCGLEINFRRIKTNPNISFYTLAEVTEITGEPGNYDVTIQVTPRFVNEKCTACNACAEACPASRSNAFNFGMDTTKAVYLPFNQTFPQQYVIDKAACKKDCGTPCSSACTYGAIQLDMQPKTVSVKVHSIVVTTGWNPYDADKIETLGSGKIPNVISNMQMERLAAVNGPTGGAINRPSDGKPVQKIAFVQCAGSRDENHLAYCSYICCMASLKQTLYVREQNPDAEVTIFYIDMRTPGRYEKFLNQIQADSKVTFIKGKVAKLQRGKGDAVIVTAEDTSTGEKIQQTFDLVVLATGMQPAGAEKQLPGVNYIEGFAASTAGIFAAGCCRNPMDVSKSAQDATSAALKAIQAGKGR